MKIALVCYMAAACIAAVLFSAVAGPFAAAIFCFIVLVLVTE